MLAAEKQNLKIVSKFGPFFDFCLFLLAELQSVDSTQYSQ